MKKIHRKKQGFTLIELLTVIAIIGILAAILIPSVGAVRVRAAMASSASDMRQMVVGYQNFATSGARNRAMAEGSWGPAVASRQNANTAADFAKVLAWFAELNDGSLYFITSAEDVASLAIIPRVILTGEGSTREASSDFDSASASISYNMARVGPNASSSTPLVWTKGLNSEGEWDADDDAPWGNRGGHIAFIGGNVEFFEAIEDQLTIASGSEAGNSTSNIEDAVGGSDVILRAD